MCVVAASKFSGHMCLVKNRDRTYQHSVKLVHFLFCGVEVLFMFDTRTGWLEGMNSEGVGIVSSALMVKQDEKKGKKQRFVRKSKNGRIILRALVKPTLLETCNTLLTFDRGILGHTLLADSQDIIGLERTYKHRPVMKNLDPDQLHVRTNHGFVHEDAGYTEGEDGKSSFLRLEQARILLEHASEPDDILPLLFQRVMPLGSPYNVVRDTEGMSTTSQIMMDLTARHLALNVLTKNCQWAGYDNRLPTGYKPKISFNVEIVSAL